MYETIIAGLVVAAISTLAGIAYRFPKVYKFIYYILMFLLLALVLMFFAYNYSIWQIEIEATKESCNCAYNIAKNREIPLLPAYFSFTGFQLYLYLLYKIHDIINYFEKDNPK